MRKKLIAGNWKMNGTTLEAEKLILGIAKELGENSETEVVIAPPATALESASEVIGNDAIGLAAQNFHWEESGAYTGELSTTMIKEIGCDWAIVGHSERRQYFAETDETVNKKVHAGITAGLKLMVCVGESLEQREADKAEEVISAQLAGGLAGVTTTSMPQVVIAYEPVWAIGTGKTATSEQAEQMHLFIRNWLAKNIGKEEAEQCRILYGGSVKPSNAKELLHQPNIDGALVGGASLKAEDFNAIIRASL